MRKTNPLDENREISKSSICGLIYHWPKQYKAKQIDMKIMYEHIRWGHASMTVLDLRCTEVERGQIWADCRL